MTILAVAGGIGVWLFYSQHQFEDAYWARGGDWSAARKGSSFRKLPMVLQWFTGKIGCHHIHHLSSRILWPPQTRAAARIRMKRSPLARRPAWQFLSPIEAGAARGAPVQSSS